MAIYDLQRQSFTMSFLAYAVSGVVGSAASLQEALRERVNGCLNDPKFTKHIGTGWQIVWGPVVYQAALSEYADDSMFVLRGVGPDDAPVYIVAIAGTNPASAFGWLQDFAVFFPVPFQDGSLISQGTRMGVSILEALPDPTTYAPLQQFLAGSASTDATLIFIGHSLCGALAPALALDLAVNLGFDLAAWKSVFMYPTAGATPGHRAFADLFAKIFPEQTTGSEPWTTAAALPVMNF